MMLKSFSKRILFLAALAVFAVCPAQAKVGDIADTIYTTDILTRVNGADIASFSIEGRTLIAMEDLRDYGFTVVYDDSVRTLYVNRGGEAKKNMPSILRGRVGGVAGYTYETDIKVIFNGEPVGAYAIDGRMAVIVEELGDPLKYGMVCAYDDGKRLLTLDNAAQSDAAASGAAQPNAAPSDITPSSAAQSSAAPTSATPSAAPEASPRSSAEPNGSGGGGGSSAFGAAGADVTVDGVSVDFYRIGAATYLDIETLKAFGFEETERNENIIMLVKKGVGSGNPPNGHKSSALGAAAGSPTVYVNGVKCETMHSENLTIIRVDNLKNGPFSEYSPCCGISAEKGADGSLSIDTAGAGFPSYADQRDAVLAKGGSIIYFGDDYSVAVSGGKPYKIYLSGLVVPVGDLIRDFGGDISAASGFKVSPDGNSLTWLNENDGNYYQFDLTDLILVPVYRSEI